MMYGMKKIVDHDAEIVLPKCMYPVKYRTIPVGEDDININISNQGSSNMTELEQRQDQLLQKLDTLYDRIKTISLHCNSQAVRSVPKQGSINNLLNLEQRQDSLLKRLDLLYNRINAEIGGNTQDVKVGMFHKSVPAVEEVVLVVSPDNFPWYLNYVLKQSPVAVNISWHVHSSVPNEKIAKINNLVKNLPSLSNDSKINIRLIFKCVSADAELKLSSLAVPIVGNVNILRYLAYVYPSIISYDHNDQNMDYLLDICHMLERTPEKNKEALVNKLCAQRKDWMYGNKFTVVDLAAYNVFKQWKSVPKYVNKPWFDKCDKLCL
ncbi:aaRS-interacting multifunctional protein 2 isoform X2 [Anticarsia gemmatalis]|uniref:aaRS-interacting multifunctional protein 2 isoform X2 n=1 Tax=Anticarsia gemmatalis TaxID=129554 RepID=UPI003F75A4D5